MFFSVLLFLPLFAATSSKVWIQDGGYREVTVHIEESTLPIMQHFLLPKLKDLFTSASSYLHTATGHRIYFHDVIILVPSHWPGDYETFVTSDYSYDVAITKRSDWSAPRTIQSRGCEEAGDVILISQAFLKAESMLKERFLVREWAKYRFGVFDEFGDVTYPDIYWWDETLLPNLCTDTPLNAIFSWGCEAQGASVSTECYYSLPPIGNSNVTSSVMADPLLPSITSFCNSTTHQRHLPNRQNVLCHYRSIWDVMWKHPDLQSSPVQLHLNTTPQFRLMKRPQTAMVMVVDSSNETAEMLHALQQSSAEFLRDILPRGTLLRVIEHGGGQAHDILPWKAINSKKDVENVLDDLPHTSEGSAALPLAIDVALEALNQTKQFNTVLLVINSICAGLQSFEPGVIDLLLAWRTRLVVFCLDDPHHDPVTDQAHPHPYTPFLLYLQRSIGAHLYISHPHGDIMSVLRGAFRKSVSAEYLGDVPNNATVTLMDRHLSEPQSQFLPLDPHLTSNLAVTFTYNVEHSIDDVMVVPPVGDVIILGRSKQCDHDTPRKMITCRVGSVEPGEWRVIVGADKLSQDLRLHVSARCQSQCLMLSSWIADFDSKNNVSQVPRVFAYLQNFGLPFHGADVVAIVTSRYYPEHTARIQLRDNGLDPDITASDGIYTAYLAPLQEGGWHYVTVEARNQRADFSSAISLASYHRVSFAGSVWIPPDEVSVTNDSALLPPSRILDLSAQVTVADSLLVTLEWTAPGADFNSGTARAYDFRWSHNHVTLRQDFSTAKPITQSDLAAGSLDPVAAGERQIIVLQLQERKSVHFAVRAVDLHANTAPTSNIASIAKQQLKRPKAKPKPEPKPTPDSPPATAHLELDAHSQSSPPPKIDDAMSDKGDIKFKYYLLAVLVLSICAILLILMATWAILHRLIKVDKHFRAGSYDFQAEGDQFLMVENVHSRENGGNEA